MSVLPREPNGAAEGQVIPIVHSVVDANILGQRIKARWRLAEPFRCELITRGMNDVYLVKSGDRKFAARVWRADRQTKDTVTWELDFLRHLTDKGIPVIAGVPDAGGALSFSVMAPEGTRHVCLFDWAHGKQYAADPKPALAHRIGATIARLHLAGRDFAPKSKRPIDFSGSEIRAKFPALARRLDDLPEERAFYAEACEAVASRLDEVYAQGVPYGPIHGDVHAKNVFVTDDGHFTILDFDTCGEAHLMHDAMSFVWANSYLALNPANRGLTERVSDEFLAGYQEVRPLEPFERACLPLFLASKEISYMCAISELLNRVGYGSFQPELFDWFAQSVRKHLAAAKLA